MKKTILSIALLVTMMSSLSSCFVNRDRRGGRTDRGRHYPHDDHHDDGHHDDSYHH